MKKDEKTNNTLNMSSDDTTTISHPSYFQGSEGIYPARTVKELHKQIEVRREEVITQIKEYINEDMTEEMAIQAIRMIIAKFEFDLEQLKTQVLIDSI
ncbi:hypothetical protein CMI47_22360 [Candidatus Pacearchaeota archaeon]|nr:hypothetical protein [Candidatus Pacearchaeota archaeon]